jgi:hypothetical protein
MVRDVLERWMAERRVDLIDNYDSKGLRASGAFADGIKIKTTEYQSTMTAPPHVGVMVTGRKPNKNQMPAALRAWVGWAGSTFLNDWVQDKGLDLNAYAVAWKIAREGISVPNAHNDGRLLDDTFTAERMEELNRQLGKMYTTTITSEIKKIWQ